MYELRTAEVVIVIDQDQKMVMVSKDSFKILGYINSELIGQKVTILMEERKARVHQYHIDNFVKDGAQRSDIGKFKAIRKDGSTIDVYVWIYMDEAIKFGDGYLILGGLFDAEVVDNFNDSAKRQAFLMNRIDELATAWLVDKKEADAKMITALANIQAIMGVKLNPLMNEEQKQMSIQIINEGGKASQDTNLDAEGDINTRDIKNG